MERNINAFSLRMGREIDYSYATDQKLVRPLDLKEYLGNFLMWDWTKGNPREDWYYPMSVAGNIYRRDRMINLWDRIPFSNPNLLEGYMNANRDFNYPYQMSYNEMHILNVANNLVQTVCENRFDSSAKHSVGYLNSQFLKGKRLGTKNLYDKTFNSPNLPVEYIWQ